MPSLIGSLYVSLTANLAPFQRSMRQADGVVATTATSMRRHMGLTERSVTGLQRQMNSGIRPYALISAARTFDTVQQRANLLRGALFATTAAFGGLGAALTTNVVSRYLDSFTGLENQMRVVSKDAAGLAANMGAVQNVAERSRASLAAVATLFSRISKSSPDEGPAKTLRRVETINKALQLGGASAQEASSAAIQFSQAIASNRLGGEELRAVLETPLGLELARGLGVTIGKFREMGYAGELTADMLFKSLDKIAATIDGQFARSISTIDQALTVADGKITAYAGSLDDAYGITKLITSAIGGFADNLETIIPLLALVGGGLGTVFGGRLLGGLAGGRVNSVRDAVRGVIDSRKDALRIAKEELAITQKQVVASREQVRAATAARADPLSLAPKSVVNAYTRDLAAIEKADAKHLALIQQKALATTQLGEIYKTTTVGELRAAQALADQQMKLNGVYAQQRDLKRQVVRGENAVTGGAGLSSQTRGTLRTQTEAQKALNDLKKQEAAIAKNVATEEGRLAARRQSILKETNSAYLAAANQRAAIIVNEKKLTQELADSEQRRASLVGRARLSRGAAEQSGLEIGNKALSDSEKAALASQRAVDGAGAAMREAGKAASGMAIGFGIARMAGSSLVGFLGGPWGVAFTAAIGILTYFGIKARETAEDIARAQQVIQEELEKAGLADGGKEAPINIQQALLDKRIAAETKRLEDVTKEMQRQRDDLSDALYDLTANEETILGSQDPLGTAEKIAELAERFRTTKMSVVDLKEELLKLGVSSEAVDAVVQKMKAAEADVTLTEFAIGKVQDALKALDGQRADVGINLNVIDPLGVFAGGKLNLNAGKMAKEIRDRSQYGAGQNAMREEVARLHERNALLEGARQINDKIVTSQMILTREQELFAAGVVRTREEARELALQLFAMEGKTIEVRIDLKPLDPLGVLKPGSRPALQSGDLQDQREQMGAAQAAMRLEIDHINQVNRLKAESAQINDEIVTSTQIAAREQELLESGVARSRDEARGLAMELFALEGKVIDVQIRLNVLDPLGVFTKGYTPSLDPAAREQRALYGVGQNAAREQTGMSLRQRQLLEDASDTGDKALNTPAKVAAREQQLLEQGYAKTREAARALAQTELDLSEASRQSGKSAGSAAKDYEKFANKLKELQEQGDAAFLSDLDRKVVDFAKSLKDGSEMMRQYIEAVNSGDMSQAPAELLQARDALMEIGAAETWRGIMQQYGSGAQLAGLFAEKQNELNFLVAEGKITAEQAGVAYADFISQFGNYEWVNQLSGALVQFADSAITDFENIEDAAMSLLKAIGKIVLQLTVLGPLENYLKGALGGAATGGGGSGGGGIIGSIIGGIGSIFGGGGGDPWSGLRLGSELHGGGTAGVHGKPRLVPSSAIAGAPRFHDGTKPNEIVSVLEKGEEVLRRDAAQRGAATVKGLISSARSGGGRSGVDITVGVNDDGKLEAFVARTAGKAADVRVQVYDRAVLPSRVAQINQDPRRR